MADLVMSRARRLFQYVNLSGTTYSSDGVSGTGNHPSDGLTTVRITNNNTNIGGEENVHINNNSSVNGGMQQQYSQSPNGGSITNMTKMIQKQKQKRWILGGTVICGVAALIIIVMVSKQDASNK